MFFRGTFVLVLILTFFACPLVSGAEELVSGRYTDIGGNVVIVELTVGSPAPASVILVQNFPKGAKVTASRPELKMYSEGKAKWLLSKVVSGKSTVSATLDRPINKGEISGEIRYRGAAGTMVSSSISK